MEKDNLEKRKIKLTDFVPLGLIFIGVFSFLFFTGTLNSGYHFVDDHEMLSIESGLKNSSFWDVSSGWVKSSLHARFRPMYYFHRVFEMKIFGPNFPALALYTALLAALTFALFWQGAKKMKFSNIEALFFIALTFIGVQSSIWWRLGPAETIGMVFLGFSFFFLAKAGERKKYFQNSILFIVFLLLASFCKESFVVVIPAFTIYKVWYEKKVFAISAKESIRNNLILLIPLIVMLVEFWAIVFRIGTNDIGYAGMTSSIRDFFDGVKNIFYSPNSLLNWINLLRVLVPAYLISFLFVENKKQDFIQSLNLLFPYLLFSLLIVLPNIFMYAKSGMIERYLLPTTLGLAFLAVGFWKNTKGIIFKSLAVLAILIFLITSFNVAKTNAVLFAIDGKTTNALLSAVTKNSNPNSKILLVVDPVVRYEVSWSLKTYLSSHGFENVFGYPIMGVYVSDFQLGLRDQWIKWFENRNLKDMKKKPDVIVFIDKIQSDIFFNQSDITQSKYKNVLDNNSSYAVYTKNNQ